MSKAIITTRTEVKEMEGIIGILALAAGFGICAAGGLLASQVASRRAGVDLAEDEMSNPAERRR